MNAQAVTAGARVGRRLNPILLLAARQSPDRVSFCGGLIASIAGGIAGLIGAQTTAELVRIALHKLEGTPQLELPPGVRLAIAAADAEPEAPHLFQFQTDGQENCSECGRCLADPVHIYIPQREPDQAGG